MKHETIIEGEHSPGEIAKFIGVLAVIVLTATFLNSNGSAPEWFRWFMGVFFVVFASFKLVGYRMFVMMFAGYDVVAKRLKTYAYAYPFIELGLGLLYLFNKVDPWRDVLTLVVMSVGIIGVFQEIKKRSGIHCACLGNVIKLPLSTVSFVEDLAMALMAACMLLY